MSKANLPPRICTFCNATDYITDMHAGWDVSPEGEDDQHLDKCKCGARRLWGVFHSFEGTSNTWTGEWYKNELP